MNTISKTLTAVVLVTVAFATMYWKVFLDLVADWSTNDNYSHGFLIVPLAAYLTWERRRQIVTAKWRPTAWGVPLIALGIFSFAIGSLGSEAFLTRISPVCAAAGVILFLGGWQPLRVLAFPLAVLLLMIPLPAIVFNQIAFPLQLFASRAGEAALEVFRIPVLREGNVLVLANTTLEVAEACSGIRSLVSLLTLAIVYGYFSDHRWWVRTAIALSTIPIAVIANGARVAGTGVAAHYIGPAAAEGFLHTFSGWLIFIVALALTYAWHRVLLRFGPADAAPSALRVAA